MRLGVFILLLSMAWSNYAYAKERVVVLTSKNTVTLRLPVTPETVEPVQKAIRALANAGSKDIYLVLNSPGGSIYSGRRLIDAINGIGVRVHTISMFSASMSFMISQALGQRLAIPSATIMSHRASAGGLSGQIPGSLITRTNSLLAEVLELELMVSNRAGIPHGIYTDLVRDELWMTGTAAHKANFMDEVVQVRCDKSLEGNEAPIAVQVLFFELNVSFSKCPLLEEPAQIEGPKGMDPEKVLPLYYKFLENSSPEPSFSRWGGQHGARIK